MEKEFSGFVDKIKLPIFLVLFLWLVTAVNYFFHLDFRGLGVYPRDLSTLPYIFTSPFVHANWDHLISNTSPILVLTSIMVLFYRKVAVQSFFVIMVGTGLLVWIFARESYHIGASGMVYGLVSFVFWTGVFKKNIKSIILALIVLTLYAGLFTSIFPNVEANISWESHLFGGISGLISAFVFKSVVEDDELEFQRSPWEDDDQIKQYFLPRDVFEKTKMQRYQEYIEAERYRVEMERRIREQNSYIN
jgi:membrane associated rhomboid family serine protease